MMIVTRKQLKNCLAKEKEFYAPYTLSLRYFKSVLMRDPGTVRWNYIKTLRKLEFYFNNRNKSFIYAMLNAIYARKFNSLGLKLGIELDRNVFDEGLMIFHAQ